MHRFAALAAVVVLAASLVAGAAPTFGADKKGRSYIVVLRNDTAREATISLGRGVGAEPIFVYEEVLDGFAAKLTNAQAARLRRDPRVASVELDRPVRIFAEEIPTGVDRIGGDSTAENAPPTQAGVPTAVLDTGIALHPDLTIRGGLNCTPSGGPRDWRDRHGHGTHVAGTIGAKNQGSGVVGVAPGTPLYAVKVLGDDGRGANSWIICGLDYVTRSGIKVANMSLGAEWPSEDPSNCNSSAYHQAFCRAKNAGVKVIVAAGNDNKDASLFVPAKYEQVMTVSALNDIDGCTGGLGGTNDRGADDTVASFSNFGVPVDVTAPGVDIKSTWLNGGYNTIDGTSMAAPHVAGAVALGWNPSQKEPGPNGDKDSSAEGILNLSANITCANPGVAETQGQNDRGAADDGESDLARGQRLQAAGRNDRGAADDGESDGAGRSRRER